MSTQWGKADQEVAAKQRVPGEWLWVANLGWKELAGTAMSRNTSTPGTSKATRTAAERVWA